MELSDYLYSCVTKFEQMFERAKNFKLALIINREIALSAFEINEIRFLASIELGFGPKVGSIIDPCPRHQADDSAAATTDAHRRVVRVRHFSDVRLQSGTMQCYPNYPSWLGRGSNLNFQISNK